MQLMRRLVPLVALCVCLVLASCEAISSTTGTSVTPAPTVITTHRNAVFVQYCIDDTGSYPRADFFLANKLVASSLQQSVAANTDGMQLYATLIVSNTDNPVNTLAPFVIPAIPAYPTLPTPLATPPNDNPVSYGATATAVANQNNTGITKYNTTVAQTTAQVKAIEAQITSDTGRLTNWNPKIDSTATSVWGCLQLARQRFTSQTGTKYLIIASDMQNNTNVDYTSDFTSSKALKGVNVHVVFYDCENSGAGACQNLQNQWTSVFNGSGAASVQFNDPAQSETLGNLFGGA